MEKQEIIEKRKTNISYEEAKELHNELIEIYKKEYKKKHNSDDYLKIILDYEVSEITERSYVVGNYYADCVYECFSCVSQHVYGYTKEHCLDQIYECIQKRNKRIEEYKKLPTLEAIVYSDIEIDPEKIYYTKEKGSYEDSCEGCDGNSILRMREIGIEEYNKECFNKFITKNKINNI